MSRVTLAQDFLFVGDIHGRLGKLKRLWENVQHTLPPERFSALNAIFLGDYCDRGNESKEVVEFLSRLPERYPFQKHHFLCGNHDFGLAAFLGLPPFSFVDLAHTTDQYLARPHRDSPDSWYDGPTAKKMHVQGRRWGACAATTYKNDLFNSKPTFQSYGVKFPVEPSSTTTIDDNDQSQKLQKANINARANLRQDLFNALPFSHRSFFSSLQWIYRQKAPFGEMIAVHAGLEASSETVNMGSQLEDLIEKYVHKPWIEPLAGRENVIPQPTSLKVHLQSRSETQEAKRLYLISGHHGFFRINGRRIIVDGDMSELNAVMLSTHSIEGSDSDEEQSNSLLGAGLNFRFISPKKEDKDILSNNDLEASTQPHDDQAPAPHMNKPKRNHQPIHIHTFTV